MCEVRDSTSGLGMTEIGIRDPTSEPTITGKDYRLLLGDKVVEVVGGVGCGRVFGVEGKVGQSSRTFVEA